MPSYKRWLLIGIVAILTIVGLPLIKRESTPVQAEPSEFIPIEIQVANKFVESDLRFNCKQFADIWKGLFPNKKCQRFRTNIGTNHWECVVYGNLWIDANWDLQGSIRTYEK